jgi:hypothetical protein
MFRVIVRVVQSLLALTRLSMSFVVFDGIGWVSLTTVVYDDNVYLRSIMTCAIRERFMIVVLTRKKEVDPMLCHPTATLLYICVQTLGRTVGKTLLAFTVP